MSKKPYIKPTFVKQMAGVMNKFGNSYYKSYKDSIDNTAIDTLTEKYGSPLFVFSEKKLRRQYRDIYEAFSTQYPNVQFSWSYKTNYLGSICNVFHQEGATAEVVSEFEYDKARSNGIAGKDIIFNGPHKGKTGLEKAFTENAMVNIDNSDEIVLAESVAKSLNKKVKVGIRLNLDAGIYPQWYKFGFNLENKQAFEAVKRIMHSEFLHLNGLHCHIGTFILDPKAYALQAEKMLVFLQEIENSFSITMEYIDIGGGFPSHSRLKGIYLPPDVVVPNINEYADAICSTMFKFLKPNEYPKLYLETGRALVDEAGYIITSVVGQKTLPDGVRSYFVDSGINLLYTSTWYNFNIQPDRQLSGVPEQCRIYGCLCMNIDVIAESVYLPPLPKNSRLVISPVGAYNTTQWMQFITYRPAVVMIMEDGSSEVIRRSEKLEDVTHCEIIPEKLKLDK